MKKESSNIINLGCRLNIFEGEVIKSHIKNNKFKNYIIINSCAVTEEAEKKVNYEIRKSKRNFPNKKIVVTGCAAQINPEKYMNLVEVDYVIGNKEKLLSTTWTNLEKNESTQVKDIFNENNISNNIIQKFEGKSRAYVEIQQGCDHRCTFCIIPFGRGNNRSVPVGVISERIKTLVANGYNEVVLTGVDITDYGKDLPGNPNLFQLVKRILNLIPELKQLRLSSLDCAEITNDFWPLLEDRRLMPHFHLSLQSGNDLILKRMKRRHNHKHVINFCKKVRLIRKDVVFGADIIAGFPTETEKMFQDTIKIIKDCNLTHLHIFPYSVRKNTPAALMPQVPKNIIKKRASILRDIGNEQMQKYLKSQIGNSAMMLVEQVKENFTYGKSQHFTKIKIKKNIKEGKIVKCMITNVSQDVLCGYAV
ncbi:MAG: Threonylcarbamoyladenosine tRNA methylthiotransferase MtaB [Alphaproteobacteria bacterium MarineAlpha5_Bin8]|nr:MAG: Threonylcarbamoyladenosine tRNA methylthiotransferase MtaB [Alphaproteobacteria bacterium MarineAlpha5_Bin7]PPR46300.1 MAG: Threonylcarbamoyladenosine tRNA methylthiotransferase MtaB [Alphaproteobacteria bacterium MarineAlpha5_Bin8]PPR54885.1 MAG: Threonylcarbamoyladenosine tRNA methylthiotransferase MtaB [Alphaproteobacteria bacterium MarineAlpha5_Bin6]|tara:strand:+ start:2751 stop:4013 length:1263 start_codon:yes stop_codon:yes gene_type:complete